MPTSGDRTASDTSPIFARPIAHIGYTVSDLEQAVELWTRTFGAGPFFLLDHITFDQLVHPDGPAVWDHSAAFGQCGEIAIELQQMYTLEPDAVRSKLVSPSNRPNHVAYYADDPMQESARLEEAGMPMFLRGTTGPVEIVFHDVPWLGHSIEIHRDTEWIRGMFAQIAEAAKGWDGSDPLRAMPTG